MSYTYKYPHPALTADCVVFGIDNHELFVLLVERGNEPFKGTWAFPGGFMNMDETAEECAIRELQEETGLQIDGLRQIGAFSAVHRDPRERVVSVVFYAFSPMSVVKGGDDAHQAKWFPVSKVPQLAFDHDEILSAALQCLRKDICYKEQYTPEHITSLKKDEIFVFGSNLEGMHAGGAARVAYEKFGAVMGQGVGLQGQSYAIPTMQGGVDTIEPYVKDFFRFADCHPELTFLVTRIGCGIAGFTDAEIAPLFVTAVQLPNVHLPESFWREIL